MKNKDSVNLEDYKGSNIEKGLFCKEQPLSVEQTLKNNLEKGLIDQDLFDKAMCELDMLKKGKKSMPFEAKKDEVEKAKEEDKKEEGKEEEKEEK